MHIDSFKRWQPALVWEI